MVQNAIVRVLLLGLGVFVTDKISLNNGYRRDRERKASLTMALEGISMACGEFRSVTGL